MIRRRSSVTALLLAASVLLTGCGGGTNGAAPASALTTTPTQQTPTTSPTRGAAATPTGPSGETPVTRRGALGGCPAAATITTIAGTTMDEVAKPDAPLICSYSSRRTTRYDGITTAVVQLTVAEPVAISGKHSLSGYQRSSSRNNATAAVNGLGAGAFVSFIGSAPELCAAWFTAADGKILTSSALAVPSGNAGKAGPDSSACRVAVRFAAAFA